MSLRRNATKIFRYGIFFFCGKKCMVLKTTFIAENSYKVGSIVKVQPGLKEEALKAKIIDLHGKLYIVKHCLFEPIFRNMFPTLNLPAVSQMFPACNIFQYLPFFHFP